MKKILSILLMLALLLPAALAEDAFSFGVFHMTAGEGWTGQPGDQGMTFLKDRDALILSGVDLVNTGMAQMAEMLGAGLMMDMIIQSSYSSIADVNNIQSFTLENGAEGRRLPASIGEGFGLCELGMLCHGGYMLMIMSTSDSADRAVANMDEALSWITLQDAAAVEIAVPQARQADGSYLLPDASLTLRVDPEKYAVLAQNNAADDPSLALLGYNKAQADNYMLMSNKDLMVIPAGGAIDDLNISIRVKPGEYQDVPDLAALSEADQQLWMTTLASSFGADECFSVQMDSATYCAFDAAIAGQSQRRYATIKNNALIYIWAESTTRALAAPDVETLEEIVNGVTFGE